MNPPAEPDPEGEPVFVEGWQARLAYVVYLGCVSTAFILALQACGPRPARHLAKAGLSLVIGLAAREWVRRTGQLEACRESFINMDPGRDLETPLGTPEEEARFRGLIARRAALEKLRGSPGFDVWELHHVRHQLDDFVEAHPAFRERLHGRPDEP